MIDNGIDPADMQGIDKKIDEVANDNLDGIEQSLNYLDNRSIINEISNLVEDCNDSELRKIAKYIINIHRTSFNNN
jgi:hypothetical protein|tara:strand:+ start:67 stop:294 length:228 start_codon:yes stop_codon:yes gene_type:complete